MTAPPKPIASPQHVHSFSEPAFKESPVKSVAESPAMQEAADVIRAKDTMISELMAEVQAAHSLNNSLQAAKDRESHELREKLLGFQQHAQEVEAKMRQGELDRQSLRFELSKQLHQIEELSTSLDKLTAKEAATRTSLGTQQNLNAQLTEENTKLARDKAHLTRELEEHSVNLQKKIKELRNLASDKQSLEEKIDQLRASSNRLDKEKERVQDTLRKTEHEKTAEIHRLKKLISDQQEANEDLQHARKTLQNECRSLEDELDAAKTRISSLRDENSDLSAKVAHLKDLLHESSNRKYNLDEKEQMLNSLEAKWQAKFNGLAEENEQLRQKLLGQSFEPTETVVKMKRNKSRTSTLKETKSFKLTLATASKLVRDLLVELSLDNPNDILAAVVKLNKYTGCHEVIDQLVSLTKEFGTTGAVPVKGLARWFGEVLNESHKVNAAFEDARTLLSETQQVLGVEQTASLPRAAQQKLAEVEHLRLLLNKVKRMLQLSQDTSLQDLEQAINEAI